MDPSESVCFRDQEFINSNPLNENNILDYFASSQFYDNSCTNEVLKMQTKFANLSELKQKLDQMIGIQYILDTFNDERTLFIIKKLNRFSINDYEISNVYYCMHGNIYQCPTNVTIFNSRLSNFYFYLNEAFDYMEESIHFDLFKGISYGKNEQILVHEKEKKDSKADISFFNQCMQDFYDNKE